MSIDILKIPFQGEYIVQGDTIAKTLFTFTDEDIDLTTATIKMQIYNGNTRIIDVSNGDGITVIDSENFEIDEVLENDLPVGKHLGDLEITDEDGKRFTYFRVQYEVLKQYTI